MQNQIIGAIKIKDGLFIGDEYAAQDLEFINTNKVTHIINCAGQQVPNHFQFIKYLSFQWQENDKQVVFDEHDENLNMIFTFMEQCFSLNESCLVHSVRGQSRSCCVLAAYLMRKYSWTLYKSLEFLNSRRPDLEIRASFFYQLDDLEKRLASKNPHRTATWDEICQDDSSQVKKEEIIIRNTFVNSQIAGIDDIYVVKPLKDKMLEQPFHKFKLRWRDQISPAQGLITVIFNGSPELIPITDKHIPKQKYYKSALKGSQQVKRAHTQQSTSISTQPTSQLRSLSSKSLGDQERALTEASKDAHPIHHHQPSNSTFSQASYQQLSNNPSFNNLLVSSSVKSKETKKENRPQPQPQKILTAQPQQLINSKPPLQQNISNMQPKRSPLIDKKDDEQSNILRSSSLQQFEERNQHPERPNSVKDQPSSANPLVLSSDFQSKSIMSSFQDFKQQVQMSLNYFNQKDNRQQPSYQLNPPIEQEKNRQSYKQLDQLISPTTTQAKNNNQNSYSNLSKLQNNSILADHQNGAQIQSNYQKYQNLTSIPDSKNSFEMRNSSLPKPTQEQNTSKRPSSAESQKLSDYNKIPKKPIDQRGSVAQKPSPSNLKQRKQNNTSGVMNNSSSGAPIPQNSSHLYLRNVQTRRQASSTMRNQRGGGAAFNQSGNYSNSNSSQVIGQNNSYQFEKDTSKFLDKQVEMLSQNRSSLLKNLNESRPEFSQLKKTLSPTQSFVNSKSQTQFQKNQPVKVTQDINDKFSIQFQQPQPVMREKDPNTVSNSLINVNIQFKQPRQFSPGLKSENSMKIQNQSQNLNSSVMQKQGITQNLRQQKFRSSSPGVAQKENDMSSFQSYLGPQHRPKNSWKML